MVSAKLGYLMSWAKTAWAIKRLWSYGTMALYKFIIIIIIIIIWLFRSLITTAGQPHDSIVSSWLTPPRNFKGNTGSWDSEWERLGKICQFLANKSRYLRNGSW